MYSLYIIAVKCAVHKLLVKTVEFLAIQTLDVNLFRAALFSPRWNLERYAVSSIKKRNSSENVNIRVRVIGDHLHPASFCRYTSTLRRKHQARMTRELECLSLVPHPYKGRAYVVTRPLRRGDVALRAKPYAAIPDSMSRRKCYENGVHADLPLSCEKCRQTFYCSRRMLKDLFQGHSPPKQSKPGEEIPIPNGCGFDNYTLDYAWAVMRILTRRVREQRNETAEKPSQDCCDTQDAISSCTFEDIWALCTNMSSFSSAKLAEFKAVARHLCSFVRLHLLPILGLPASAEATILPPPDDEPVPDLETPLEQSLLSLICKEECNSFGLYTFKYEGPTVPRQGYGLAVYPLAAFFNHSCSPNIGHVTINHGPKATRPLRGPEMVFYAISDVAEGEEAVISYVALEPASEDNGVARRQRLEEHFHFKCDCARCEQEQKGDAMNNCSLSRHFCGTDGCQGWYVPTRLKDGDEASEWVCEACHRIRRV
ncbi:hypothetical protein BC832DRAFT_538283 [Gaertneriomyces semiglobifer]|nr:hypothetical protein BC832DRAFT_538283 [Gaertneriomyces semiglobifer]